MVLGPTAMTALPQFCDVIKILFRVLEGSRDHRSTPAGRAWTAPSGDEKEFSLYSAFLLYSAKEF